jgi:hypothetical protein
MQTAAGVAAGALAFEGIESLMHGFGHAAGYGQGFGGFGGDGQRPDVINNYYGDDRGEHGGGHSVSADERALGQQEDRDFGSLNSKSDSDALYGTRNDPSSGDDQGFDSNSNLDDASFDDSGSGFGDDGSDGGDDGSFA